MWWAANGWKSAGRHLLVDYCFYDATRRLPREFVSVNGFAVAERNPPMAREPHMRTCQHITAEQYLRRIDRMVFASGIIAASLAVSLII
jgi:hypothetical protein